MASLEEIRQARLAKLKLLEERGINPYPVSSRPDLTLAETVEKFDGLAEAESVITLAGRILSIRGQGKIVFFTFDDGTGRFQAVLREGDPTPADELELFASAFDMGDFVEVEGTLFTTQRGEQSILVRSVRMLAKSLRPLPEKWHGLSDTEERFRRRYLDILSNSEVKDRFVKRSKIVTEIRRFLDTAGFLEVETPALQPIYGGASAEPFVTHHNALDMDLYLRISDELYLKRLLAAGFPKVYEIARDFRNEGIDHTHNPEFTMLEFYEAYSDAERQRVFVEKLVRSVVKAVSPDGVIEQNGRVIDFNKPFAVKTYADAITEKTQLKDPLHASLDELRAEATRLGAAFNDGDSKVKVLDTLFKKIRPELINPIFLVDYPVDMLPLTKRKEGEEDIVDAFQMYAGGIELVKAFSELNDPLDQRARFEKQEEFKKEGEADAQVLDEDFLEAMEHGIPPAGGVGIGIDRLAMLLTGTDNIKEVILFPTLRPKNDEK